MRSPGYMAFHLTMKIDFFAAGLRGVCGADYWRAKNKIRFLWWDGRPYMRASHLSHFTLANVKFWLSWEQTNIWRGDGRHCEKIVSYKPTLDKYTAVMYYVVSDVLSFCYNLFGCIEKCCLITTLKLNKEYKCSSWTLNTGKYFKPGSSLILSAIWTKAVPNFLQICVVSSLNGEGR